MMERLKQVDKNQDKKISREEAEDAPRLKEHFEKIDANKDGELDSEELKRAAGAMMKRMHLARHAAGGRHHSVQPLL